MSAETDFQNGFVCGMATKGMLKSGQPYSPDIYNDTGYYTYFYVDFRRALKFFSLGQLIASFTVIGTGTTNLAILGVTKISSGLYKVDCNFTGLEVVSVVNKSNGYLHFYTGGKIPAFTKLFTISGVTPILQPDYCVEDFSGVLTGGGWSMTASSSAALQTPTTATATDSFSTNFIGVSAIMTTGSVATVTLA